MRKNKISALIASASAVALLCSCASDESFRGFSEETERTDVPESAQTEISIGSAVMFTNAAFTETRPTVQTDDAGEPIIITTPVTSLETSPPSAAVGSVATTAHTKIPIHDVTTKTMPHETEAVIQQTTAATTAPVTTTTTGYYYDEDDWDDEDELLPNYPEYLYYTSGDANISIFAEGHANTSYTDNQIGISTSYFDENEDVEMYTWCSIGDDEYMLCYSSNTDFAGNYFYQYAYDSISSQYILECDDLCLSLEETDGWWMIPVYGYCGVFWTYVYVNDNYTDRYMIGIDIYNDGSADFTWLYDIDNDADIEIEKSQVYSYTFASNKLVVSENGDISVDDYYFTVERPYDASLSVRRIRNDEIIYHYSNADTLFLSDLILKEVS